MGAVQPQESKRTLAPVSSPDAAMPAEAVSSAAAVELKSQPGRVNNQQEVDVWWGSYSARTMIPTLVLCTLLSVGIAVFAGRVWDEQRAHPQLMWHLSVLLIVLVWLIPLLLFGYRTVALNYRLTTQRLFRDRGFHHPPSDGEIDLTRITAVRVQYPGLSRWSSVGRIWIDTEGAASLVLHGVYEPERVADLIRGCAQRAREREGKTRTV